MSKSNKSFQPNVIYVSIHTREECKIAYMDSKLQLYEDKINRKLWNTVSLYIRRRSFTTSSVSSERVISLEAQFWGGRRGAIFIPGLPFSPLMSMEAILKFPPHWLQILLPRHFWSSTSSLSFRLITKSMSVTPSSISYRKKWISWHKLTRTKWPYCAYFWSILYNSSRNPNIRIQ